MAIKNKIYKASVHRKISNTLRQKVWNYMRRNRTFRFGDLMIITQVKFNYLKEMLVKLELAGYIKIIEEKKPYSSSYFTLVKCTGVHSPTIRDNIIYDYNTQEEIDVRPTPSIRKILDSLTQEKMNMSQVLESSKLGKATVKKCFVRLREQNVIKEIAPIQRINGEKAFLIDTQKVEQLKQEIHSGAFKIKGAFDEHSVARKSV